MSINKVEQIKLTISPIKLSPNLVSMVRHKLTIGNKSVLAFMDAQGLYYLHSAQAANLIDKKGSAIENFIIQNALSSQSRSEGVDEMRLLYRNGSSQSLGWDPSVFVEDGNNKPFRVIPLQIVTQFIRHWDKKNHLPASILTDVLLSESLQIRCESVFVGASPNVASIIEDKNKILREAARNFTKQIQPSFQQSCMLQHFPAAKVHDRITYLVTGQTAKMAIENNPCVGENPDIGLDHQSSPEDLEMIGLIKVKFTGYRKGTWQERVDRAYSQLN